jgi:D-threo-aldose 1-dehydrogenase
MRHPAVTSVVTGPRNVSELQTYVDSFDFPIPDSVWVELESSGLVDRMRD